MNYNWVAEQEDGLNMITGENLSSTVRFSFIPSSPLLPRHDIISIKMERRFLRTFHKIRFNDTVILPGKLFWEDGKSEVFTDEDLQEYVKSGMLIKKKTLKDVDWHIVLLIEPNRILLDRPYKGITKKVMTVIKTQQPNELKYHCVVCSDHRIYMNDADGRILITPKEYELYI